MDISGLFIGNLTIDHNFIDDQEIISPGGSVFFCAKTFENLGLKSTIVSSYGADFPKKYLTGTFLIPDKPLSDKTLIFRNVYHNNGSRSQWVDNYNKCDLSDLKDINRNSFINKDIIIVCPIIPNISVEQIIKWRQYAKSSLFILLPQGLFRFIGEDGKIIRKDWKDVHLWLSFFDMIILSDKDGDNLDSIALDWSQKGPLIILTKEEKGCSIYQKNRRHDSSGFKVKEIKDSTGAGDVFAAAYTFAYLKSKDILKSADFANASAALSLRKKAFELKYKYPDIIKFARLHGRRVDL